MTTYMNNETSTKEKLLYVVLGIVFVSFLLYIPFMISNKQEREEKAWREQGCQMYDEFTIERVPAKCNDEFVDHYKSQTQRNQP